MTMDLTSAFAFGWAGVGFVILALGAVLVSLVRDGRVTPAADAGATPDDLRPAA